MKKKQNYSAPEITVSHVLVDQLLITASPGVGGDYDPSNDEIGSKDFDFDEDEDEDTWN